MFGCPTTKIDSPLGPLQLVCSDKGLKAILFEPHLAANVIKPYARIKNDEHPIFRETAKQFAEYFSGTRKEFSLPLDPDGTDFQKKVWKRLAEIPYGQVISYSEQTQSIFGSNLAVRAVAAANGRNPLSIVIPCHRVVAATGELHGYAGGLSNKKFLLELEGHTIPAMRIVRRDQQPEGSSTDGIVIEPRAGGASSSLTGAM